MVPTTIAAAAAAGYTGITISMPPIIAIVLLVAMAAAGIRFLKKQGYNIPSIELEWAERLGWHNIVTAYLKANQEADEPDAKRDIAVAYMQDAARRYLKMELPLHTARLLVEFVVAIAYKDNGDAALAKLAGVEQLSDLTQAPLL